MHALAVLHSSLLLPPFLRTILPSSASIRTISAFRKMKEYRIESDVLLMSGTYHTSSPNRIQTLGGWEGAWFFLETGQWGCAAKMGSHN